MNGTRSTVALSLIMKMHRLLVTCKTKKFFLFSIIISYIGDKIAGLRNINIYDNRYTENILIILRVYLVTKVTMNDI